MDEFWMADWKDSWYDEEGWLRAIKMLQETGSKRPNFIFVPADRRDPVSEGGAYYVFASFLIGVVNPEYAYLWSHSIEPATQDWAREMVDIQVGTPLGTFYKDSGGLYKREFSRATVYVNPSESYRGGMAPHTGRIVLKVFLPTDLNQDGTVNVLDLSIVALAFGTNEADENYTAIADLDKNGEVNILDISMVAIDYGKTT